jgi:tRNA A37 threonylcarbamoyladenosine modification protein TsaB
MIILGLDTALAACSVAVTRDGEVLAAMSEPMGTRSGWRPWCRR